MKVLTKDGFKSFSGVTHNGTPDNLIRIALSNGECIQCTPCHLIYIQSDDDWIPARFLEIGEVLSYGVIVESMEWVEPVPVYDLIDVEDTRSFVANGIEVHNCVMLDEFAFVQNDVQFYMSTYPTISSGKDTKVIITSTPNGIGNMFHKIWEGAVTGTNEFNAFRIRWQDVPGRDAAWKAQTIANTSERQFNQEQGGEFQGSAETLISTNTLLSLKAEKPIKEQYGVKYYAEPVEGGDYFMVVDVAKGRGLDYSTFSVFGMIDGRFNQVCTFRDNMISPLIFPELIVRAGKIFNSALVIIENNDAGMVVCNTVYYDYEYPAVYTSSSIKANGIGVMMTEKVKRIGCSNLRDLLESEKLKIVDPDTIIELCTFVPKGKSYGASNGCHDDMVMPLVLFAWFLSTPMFIDMSLVDLRELMYTEKLAEMEESVPPWGYYQDSSNSMAPLNPEAMSFIENQIEQMQDFNF